MSKGRKRITILYFFHKSRSKAKVKVIRSKLLVYVWKGIVASNSYIKYQSPKSKGRKKIEILYFFIKVGQRSKSRSKVKTVGMCEKVLSQAIHMSNMKALGQRVDRKLKFIKNIIKVGQSQGHQV